MMAYLSHECRNRLFAAGETLKACALDPATQMYMIDPSLMTCVTEPLTRVGQIFDSVLTILKMKSGEYTYQHAPASLHKDILSKAVAHGSECAAKPDAPRFHADIDASIKDQSAMCSPTHLVQVLSSLLTNAFKFTRAGGTVTLSAEVEHTDDSTCTVCFSVADTGVGIPQAQMDSLFEAFSYKQRTGTSLNQGGTGLGLALSKHMVEQGHGGTLTSVSQGEGTGSTFAVRVTLNKVVGEEAHDDATTHHAADWEAFETKMAQRYRTTGFNSQDVLVVEDSLTIKMMYQANLRKMRRDDGTPVTFLVVDDGAEAVRLVKTGATYGAMLMDRELLTMNGEEAVRQIRAQGYARPIIGVTGAFLGEEQNALMESGTDLVITKGGAKQPQEITWQRCVLACLRLAPPRHSEACQPTALPPSCQQTQTSLPKSAAATSTTSNKREQLRTVPQRPTRKGQAKVTPMQQQPAHQGGVKRMRTRSTTAPMDSHSEPDSTRVRKRHRRSDRDRGIGQATSQPSRGTKRGRD